MSKGIFGAVVTWNIRNAFVSKTAIAESILKQTGIEVTMPNRGIGEYLRRALVQAEKDNLIRKVGEDDKEVGFAVVNERRNLEAAYYEARPETLVILDKETGNLSTTAFMGDRVEWIEALQNAIREGEGGLISNEVGGILKNIITDQLDGIPLRDTGGAYFVPAIHEETLTKLENAIQQNLNPGAVCRIQRFGVIAGVREAEDIAQLHAEIIEERIKEIRAEAAKMLPEIVKARPATFVRRIKQLGELKKQVELYGSTVGKAQEATHKKLDDTVEFLKKMADVCVKKRALEKAKA